MTAVRPVVTTAGRRARLARRHLLLPDARTDEVPAIADALVALHSSDPVSVYLSVLARMLTPDLAAVDRALYVDRTLVRHHAMRRTLWVTTPPTVRVMHAAATRSVAVTEHRRTVKILTENGVADPERWLEDARAQILDVLTEHGPMPARELGRRVPELTRPLRLPPATSAVTQGAHTRVVAGLGFDGVLVRARPTGTWINGQYTWAPMRDWLPGGVGDLDEREAAAELTLAWLRRFGPGTSTDLRWWAGWSVATTRRALADAGAVEVGMEHGAGWVAPEDPVLDGVQEQEQPWVAVLPGLDPTVMGWKERDFYLPAAAAPAWDRNGNAGPTIWVDGQVAGAWAQATDGTIRTHWFLDVPAARRAEAQERVEQLRQWLGATRFTVRFPAAITTRLLA